MERRGKSSPANRERSVKCGPQAPVRSNRMATYGQDRWSSKTELGLQTILACESGLRRSKPLSSFIFSCSDNLFERDCGIMPRKAGETISAQILVRKANRTMHLMFRRIKNPRTVSAGVIFFEVLLQDHASFAPRPCAFGRFMPHRTKRRPQRQPQSDFL